MRNNKLAPCEINQGLSCHAFIASFCENTPLENIHTKPAKI